MVTCSTSSVRAAASSTSRTSPRKPGPSSACRGPSLTPFRDPSLLRLAVTAARGHSADEILAVIDAELAQMAEHPPTSAEVEKAKAIAETDFWSSLTDIDGKAEALGHYEIALGDFRKVTTIAERLAQVTAEDVARVVRTYLRPERRTIVIAEPEPEIADEDEDLADDAAGHEAPA